MKRTQVPSIVADMTSAVRRCHCGADADWGRVISAQPKQRHHLMRCGPSRAHTRRPSSTMDVLLTALYAWSKHIMMRNMH